MSLIYAARAGRIWQVSGLLYIAAGCEPALAEGLFANDIVLTVFF